MGRTKSTTNGKGAAVLRWIVTGRTTPAPRPSHEPLPTRPLVSSAGQPLANGQKAAAYAGLVLLAILLGFCLGTIVWATFQASFFLARVLWTAAAEGLAALDIPIARQAATVALCAAGGLLVGWWGAHVGGLPEPFMQVIAKARATGRYESAGLGPCAAGVLLPQVFGGAVGLAAGLVGVIATGCTFIGAALRRAGLAIMELPQRGCAAIARALAHSPFDQAKRRKDPSCAAAGDPLAYDFRGWAKSVLYTAATAAGIAAFALLTAWLGTQATLPRFDAPALDAAGLAWAVPCVLLGWAGIAIFYASARACAKLDAALRTRPLLVPLVGGLVLGIAGAAFPGVLYSGIAQTPRLLAAWPAMGAAALLATGFLKCALCPWCIATGWKGGQIYPCLFAAAACGLGFAALTGADAALCLAVTAATATACLLRSPALAFCLLLLCFPVESAPLLACACLAGAALPVPQMPAPQAR